jgi:hypothetical protein
MIIPKQIRVHEDSMDYLYKNTKGEVVAPMVGETWSRSGGRVGS